MHVTTFISTFHPGVKKQPGLKTAITGFLAELIKFEETLVNSDSAILHH